MYNVYEKCPVLENDKFIIRKIEADDAEDLTLVYSDKNALPFFNSDNCFGDNFYFQTEEIMVSVINAWNEEYSNKGFVRFSIIDKDKNRAVGTIELFNRKSDDYFNNCGLLRLDLGSKYEDKDYIYNVLNLIVEPAYKLFDCNMIATKARNYAVERIEALKEMGFKESDECFIGFDGKVYRDYWVRTSFSKK